MIQFRSRTRVGPRGHAALGLLAGLVMTLAPPSGAAGHVAFAAPISGEKVSEYDVALPVRGETRRFRIPLDCAAASNAQNAGGAHWGDPVERRLWHKVMDDCAYHELLVRHPSAEHDFVSAFDFRNAPLDRLPLASACDAPGACSGAAHAWSVVAGMLASMRTLPFRPPPPTFATPGEQPHPQAEPCRLEDGLFRGYLTRHADGSPSWHCLRATDAPGFRLISVDFADINGDGYQDAVLRLIPLGGGLGHAPRVLPVTRFAADGEFVLPPRHPAPPG